MAPARRAEHDPADASPVTRILIVHPDRHAFSLAEALLAEIDAGAYATDWAGSVAEALEAIERDEHDIFLIDTSIDTLYGVDLVRAAIARGCRAPSIVLSADDRREVDLTMAEAGAAAFLVTGRLDAASLERVMRYARRQRKDTLALGKRGDRLTELVEQAPVGYHELDAEGRIVWVNRTQLDTLGYTSGDMIGRPLWDFTADAEHEAEVHRLLQNDEPWRVERTFITRDGGRVPMLVQAKRRRDADGRTIGARAILVDLTELKRAEARLRQTQKLETMGRLASGVAHDFNNLLTAILGHAELLAEMLPYADGDAHGQVEQIRLTSLRAADLTRQLLTFSRRQEVQRVPLDVNDVARHVEPMLRRLLGARVTLVFDLAPGTGTVLGDRGQLEQLIVNLAVNARDAMPDGGTLTIATRLSQVDDREAARRVPMPAGRYVKLTVTDTGHGVPRDLQDRIFEPFFTTKQPGEGTGIGLATVYAIVKQHDGFIWLTSEEGLGAAFETYLPPSGEAPAAAAAEATAADGGSETILIAEDDPAVRELAARSLTSLGYRVIAAASAAEAREAASRARIDLIIADIVMPDELGPDLIESLRSAHPGLRAMLMSGYPDGGREHVRQASRDTPFLQKPFTRAALAAAVREILDR